MKTIRSHSVLLGLTLLLTAPVFASPAKQQAAEQAAGKWLALVDGIQYDEAWRRASSLFRKQVSKAQWRQGMQAARDPLGPMTSRQLMSATYATSLPGAPDGEYVVIQYRTSFEFKKSAVETVTPMLDNGQWRVSGYYVR